ncbi:hypothetical protein EDD85DRAFT_798171 [Armillaria nabsnona]|nr:hypothetical protein EDD85DRAFT_798171 [Armillaria nabsnona]
MASDKLEVTGPLQVKSLKTETSDPSKGFASTLAQIQNEATYQARGYIEQLQREKQEQADSANRARLEAERIQQLQNEANQAHIEQLRKENHEQADTASRAKLDAEKAAKIVGGLQDQAK